ncbi:glycosyltransferase family 1 protein [Massilia antarctica]|uniref:Glycosyltransferase family 1 protein n=1 Tax=Massilia antarctica TaxID=2765360 RepID=A0AA49A676_9BURK|nr:glycosyltransferase [Massilia antarctica]QPI47851.1 glycosyltransferase family 1 protein [Massilia antarctica]
MARIVCAAPPLVGHMTPLAALAQALRECGHEVLVIDYFAQPFSMPEGVARATVAAFSIDQVVGAAGGNVVLEAVHALQHFCLHVYEDTLRHCADFKPDLLLFDQLLPLAPMIARALYCPFMYTVSSPLEFLPKDGVSAILSQGMAQAFDKVFAQMCATLAERLDRGAVQPSPERHLCFASELFCGATTAPRSSGGRPVSFIGPAFLRRAPSADDAALAAQIGQFEGRKFFVALGSVVARLASNREAAVKIFRNILLSHNEPDCLFLFSAPEDVLREAFEGVQIQATVISRPFVNQFYLLELFDLVFGHGGYNTAAECLHSGVPAITFPFVFDQTWIAQRLEELGVGVRVSRVRHSPQMLREHAARLLNAPGVAANLIALRDDARRCDGRVGGVRAVAYLCRRQM